MNVLRMLADMTLELQQTDDPAELLQRVSHYARAMLDGDDAGVVRLRGRSKVEAAAATTPRVERVHQLQVELVEGPSLDVIGTQATLLSSDLTRDPRWPEFGPAAARLGVRSTIGVPLATRERSYGSLVVYAERRDAFSDTDVEIAETLAAHAAAALASTEDALGLTAAVQTRTVIGQAQGILMQRFGIDSDAAFDYLRRTSQHHNMRLVAVAEAVVARQLP